MFEPLLQAEPSFRAQWERFRQEWSGEESPPLYLALSQLAEHLIARLSAGDTGRFDGVFDVVERWIVEGDNHVREAAVVGLLEDLQNSNLHRATRPEDFLPWLRPQSAIWWAKVDTFWAEGRPLA
ncbi:hypothetical protein AB6802_09555 [Mesorhizobium sp. RCC_202]|uniref:DUF7674 family protein n=1 Tax=Mesorhizobium sp. RCC_202 TaxID=3239222 RepID=UPI0035251356